MIELSCEIHRTVRLKRGYNLDKQTFVLYNKIDSISVTTTEYLFSQIDWENGNKPDNACGMLRGNVAVRVYRRFWIALNCRQSGKRKGQFRLWISKPVTWMWSHHRRGSVYPFCGKSVRICVPAFFVAWKPVTTEWPAGWDMILPRPLVWTERVKRRCGKIPGQEQKNDI